MLMKGIGVSYSALTVLNAMATGIGCTLPCSLSTVAEVSVSKSFFFKPFLDGESMLIDERLISQCVSVFNSKYNVRHNYSIIVKTQLPPKVGLKSSSSVSLAVMSALHSLMSIGQNASEIISLSILASKAARITRTGAFDDCCASYYRKGFITDNLQNKVISEFEYPSYETLIGYDKRKKDSGAIDYDLSHLSEMIRKAEQFAVRGNLKRAAYVNSEAYCEEFGYSFEPIKKLSTLSLVCGLNGKGPSIYCIPFPGKALECVRIMKDSGFEVLLARTV